MILERLTEIILERLLKMAQVLLHSYTIVDDDVSTAHGPALAQILMILIEYLWLGWLMLVTIG